MVIKSLTITENAYDVLSRLKHGNESFSDVIIRIGDEKSVDLEKYFGILKGGEKKAEELISTIKKRRIEFEEDYTKKLTNLKKIRGK
ncbi:MAG: antitoxin VapB family protein [Nanoarchaeota archaeon]